MDEEVLFTNANDRCKCCLGKTELRNIWGNHEFEGEDENYGEMLNECFRISWKPSDDPELICEACVSRLRDAMDFKQEILTTQEMLQEGDVIVKVEVDVDRDSEVDTYECIEYLEDDYEYLPEEVPSSSRASTPPELHEQKYPPKLPKRRKPTYKRYTMSDLRDAVKSVLSGELQLMEAANLYGIPKGTLQSKVNESATENKEDEGKGSNSDKHYKLIEDIKKLLTFTNAMPFRTKANRYYCFYCSTDGPFFEDPDDLRSHTHSKHRSASMYIETYMKPQYMNEVIKMDVHNLHCTDCHTPLHDWNKMFVHFAESHNIGFDEGYTNIIPYNLTTDLTCVLCHDDFHNYGQLDAHMNQHYSNHICHECGDTFLAANRLDKHLTVHKVGNFPCKLCDKVFTLERYRAKHCTLVHLQERKTKCLYCSEKFLDQFHRHKHVVEAHKEKVKAITCEVCGKIFTWKPYFLAHMRKRHRGEKKHKCQYCPKAFLMQHELKNHMVKHTGDKNFVCLCGESFKRSNALRKHVRLVHEGADENTIIVGV